MHLTFDFLSGSVSAIDLSEAVSTDHAYPMNHPAGSLSVFDLGYFAIQRFEQIHQQQAFFVSRLRPNTHLFADEHSPQPLDCAAVCQQVQVDRHEMNLFLGAQARVPVRVLFSRCPQVVIEERRRKAQANAKRKQRTCSAKYLAGLEWSILITNVPPTRLNFTQVVQIYAIRWQIELIFKLCKSQLHLDRVQGCGENRILCQLYARLIIFVVLCNLVSALRFKDALELSLVKAFNLFSDTTDDLIVGLKGSLTALRDCLLQLEADFLRFARKTKRKKSPSTLAFFVYDFP